MLYINKHYTFFQETLKLVGTCTTYTVKPVWKTQKQQRAYALAILSGSQDCWLVSRLVYRPDIVMQNCLRNAHLFSRLHDTHVCKEHFLVHPVGRNSSIPFTKFVAWVSVNSLALAPRQQEDELLSVLLGVISAPCVHNTANVML